MSLRGGSLGEVRRGWVSGVRASCAFLDERGRDIVWGRTCESVRPRVGSPHSAPGVVFRPLGGVFR